MEDQTHISDFKESLQKALDYFTAEIKNIKTGRATPSLVENIEIEVYGSRMPLVQLASITSPEPSLLVIKPWDQSNAKDVNKALQSGDLGATCSMDGDLIRVKFAPPTEERRLELVKKVKEKAEATRVKVRLARDKVREAAAGAAQDKAISEDEKFSQWEDVDKKTKAANETIKELADQKEKEVMTL
ncbi:MAG: ribosome recycling factor [Parcubacteria group bacterium CG1_02_37_51]|uniref:Ribosome-recycling factor n=2 Tax=Candidatus Komeiliibacteriota TaxID=1817908 RepID=A0A2M8DRE8_9BACT|nr:MAG: ribosome recycling factor [Parcubacteria group bacterium CG1_02_37_51]PIY95335.1 MAG: ribosome recycling factor [Candidatus Komeilibacteria bacterium CG_4_10_14_0_8_um_filter_37_78]PJC01931.1 MAG: ribosome recycling factor [Candidatus Komeilibacteria bacterium CG_4_9_14_0_8_um_filter_36_9]